MPALSSILVLRNIYSGQRRHVHLIRLVVYLSAAFVLVKSVQDHLKLGTYSSIFYLLLTELLSRMKAAILVVCSVIAASLAIPFADNKKKLTLAEIEEKLR